MNNDFMYNNITNAVKYSISYYFPNKDDHIETIYINSI